MAGKRTNKGKKKKARLSAKQAAYAEFAKKSIQPAAEKELARDANLEEYLANAPESEDILLVQAYEQHLKQDIHDNHADDPALFSLIPRLLKNHRIRISQARTKLSRKALNCLTFQLKLVTRNASRSKRDKLARKFLEGKWLRNDILAKGIDGYDTARTEVEVFNKATGETSIREFQALSQQERQEIHSQVIQDRSSLAKKKERGHKVGKLRFCREMRSIPLKQPGKTFYFDEKANVHIAGVGWLAVRGIDQIRGKDIARATIVKVGRDYYLHVTVYQERKVKGKYNKPNTVMAVDMGVADGMTCSEGTRFNLRFEYTETYRKLCRKLSGQQRGSRGWWKTLELITGEAAKTVNSRDDSANKAFAYLSMNETVITQDDPLPSWIKKGSRANGHKKVPLGILGRFKEKCRESDHVIMLDRFAATTKTCPYCGNADAVDLSQQGQVACTACGKERPRNTGACWNMESFAAAGDYPLPPGFVPLSPKDEEDGLARAAARSAWETTRADISAPAVLDGLLGHVDDAKRDRAGSPKNGGRKKERVRGKWVSKKLSRGKADKWAWRSASYSSYARAAQDVGEEGAKAPGNSVIVPAGRGELTLVEMMSDCGEADPRESSNCSNRQGSQKPLPIL